MDILNIFACLAIILPVLRVILAPLLIGKKPTENTYASFLAAIVEAIIFIPLALRVLGKL